MFALLCWEATQQVLGHRRSLGPHSVALHVGPCPPQGMQFGICLQGTEPMMGSLCSQGTGSVSRLGLFPHPCSGFLAPSLPTSVLLCLFLRSLKIRRGYSEEHQHCRSPKTIQSTGTLALRSEVTGQKSWGPRMGWRACVSRGTALVSVPSPVLQRMDKVRSFQMFCLSRRTFLFKVKLT